MSSRVLLLLLLTGWCLSVAGLVLLVERTDETERQFREALTEPVELVELGELVEANPLEARRVVEKLWTQGLAAVARERDGADEFEQAERLSLAIDERLGDPSLVRFTEWYERRGSSGGKQVLQIEALLQEAEPPTKAKRWPRRRIVHRAPWRRQDGSATAGVSCERFTSWAMRPG